ncbi:hypothetical protein CA833_0040 [Novosphingobium sp. KA1]|nr:hypothetical protein CA833_0040 [Novosphingobium sp. KA1]
MFGYFGAFTLNWGKKSHGATKPFSVGVCAHLWSASPQELDKTFAALSRSTFKFVRWDLPWKSVEVTKGVLVMPDRFDDIVNRINSLGMSSIIILDYGNSFYDNGDKPISFEAVQAFVRYVKFVASHFKSKIDYYEIWNEWDTRNGGTSYTSVERYLDIIRLSSDVIHEVDPKNKVLAGSFSAFTLNRFNDNPSMDNYMRKFINSDVGIYIDIISVHPYVRGGSVENILLRTNSFLKNIKNWFDYGDFSKKPIMITEFGWRTAGNDLDVVSQEGQNILIKNTLRIAREQGYLAACLYELKDSGHDEDYGIYSENWERKKSSSAFDVI